MKLDKIMEKVPQLTEDQKLIVEALKARQEKVRIPKRLGFTSHFYQSFLGIKG